MNFTIRTWISLVGGGGGLGATLVYACTRDKARLAKAIALVLTFGIFFFLILWGTDARGILTERPNDFEKNIVLAAGGGFVVHAIRWLYLMLEGKDDSTGFCIFWGIHALAGLFMGVIGAVTMVACTQGLSSVIPYVPSPDQGNHLAHAFFGLLGGGAGWKLPQYLDEKFRAIF